MITDADITKLKEVFVTKEEFFGVKSDVSDLKIDVSTLKSDVSTLKSDVSTLKSDVSDLKVDSSLIQQTLIRMEQKLDDSIEFSRKNFGSLEGLSGKVADLEQENKQDGCNYAS